MNTNTNETVNQPKRRGRPLLATATRVIHVNPVTGEVYGKGRIANGKQVLRISIHRSLVKSYIHGTTPIVSSETITVQGKPKTAGNVNVVVIQPTPEVAPETKNVETGEPVAV